MRTGSTDARVGTGPGLVGVVAGIAALLFVVCRVLLADGDVSSLIRAGDDFTSTAADIAVIEGTGYDGQFYYRQAIDPLSTDDRVGGVTLDRPAYRSARIGYPAAVWALSLGGNPDLVKWMLPAINVLSVGAIGALGASIARRMDRSAWCGLLFAWWPGMVVGLAYDLAEPLEAALVVGTLVLLRRHAAAAAAIVLSYAAVTRETSLLVALAVLAVGVLRLMDRWMPAWVSRWSKPEETTPWLVGVLPFATFASMQLWMAARWDEASTKATQKSISFVSVPFLGLGRQVRDWIAAADVVDLYQLVQVLVMALLLAVLARSLARTEAGTPIERVAFLGALASVIMLENWDRMVIFLRYPDIAVITGLTIFLSATASRLPEWASPSTLVKVFALLLASVVPVWLVV